MIKQPQKIIFCVRAYNDIDMQLPLVRAFVEKGFKPDIIFFQSDGFITHHKIHEATRYFQEEFDLKFQSLFQLSMCPLHLRILYGAQSLCRDLRKLSFIKKFTPFSFLFKVFDVGLSRFLKPFMKKGAWYQNLSRYFADSIVITDEAFFQTGRSDFLDYILRPASEKGTPVYCILTGHRVYRDINPSGQKAESSYKPSKARFYLVPSQHNKQIYDQLFPQENIRVGGNVRMDKSWVKELSRGQVVPFSALPENKVKVAIMLSKMNYGVEAENLKLTIRTLGTMPDVSLALKPHTRGMKFDFMPLEEIGHGIIADDISSTSLINWADVLLMTGSSVVFHAMVAGKVAGFLKYCQSLETIFDDGKSCVRFDSLSQLQEYIQSYAKDGKPVESDQEKSDREAFITHEIFGDLTSGLTAAHYRDLILNDYTGKHQS